MANIGPDNFELVKELLGDKNTMNRSTLEEVLFEELGFSREMSRVFVTQFFQTISDVLATGEEVKLTTLGRFEICGRAYKMFFDPEARRSDPFGCLLSSFQETDGLYRLQPPPKGLIADAQKEKAS